MPPLHYSRLDISFLYIWNFRQIFEQINIKICTALSFFVFHRRNAKYFHIIATSSKLIKSIITKWLFSISEWIYISKANTSLCLNILAFIFMFLLRVRKTSLLKLPNIKQNIRRSLPIRIQWQQKRFNSFSYVQL